MLSVLATSKPVTAVMSTLQKLQTVRQAAIITFLFYVAFTFVGLALHDWNPLWFVWLKNGPGTSGYDGLHVYWWALEGFDGVISQATIPEYRLQRIFYPVVVEVLSFRQVAVVPWVMLGVNIAAITFATREIAIWLKRQNLWVGYALMYSLYVGTFMAYSRDLTEPLAFGLIIVSIIWLLDNNLLGGVPLALALLTKEITLLFLLGFLAADFLSQNWKRMFVVGIAGVPFAVWQLYLFQRFGSLPITNGPGIETIPFMGFIPHLA